MGAEPLDVEAIRARAAATTPGPWDLMVLRDLQDWWGNPRRPQPMVRAAGANLAGLGTEPDAEFVAHAREDVPALCDLADTYAWLLAEARWQRDERARLIDVVAELWEAAFVQQRVRAEAAEQARDEAQAEALELGALIEKAADEAAGRVAGNDG